MAEKFDHLEEHLEKFVENIRQLGIIVSDFQPSSQAGLNQKLNFIVTGLQDIDKCRQQLHDITVPLEVFEYIDQGRNPQLYTKECLERALAKNEQVKGKIDTMKPWFHENGDEDGDAKSPRHGTARLGSPSWSSFRKAAFLFDFSHTLPPPSSSACQPLGSPGSVAHGLSPH
ncbi:mediator of RNA polymerase II transcription subunit 10 isoform X1 [Trachypithecus francoisi]|uniref:mediator of RNA polymerase II transcription subunit 10 isoform X1 n=1 Tax=Trachypithecus francoisi TaxID=54180 RepID=UPI00141AAC45|nr:mediator of RNA polymerase II transcription subunit 10 isoform X1 [Trachypithecus francoisi]